MPDQQHRTVDDELTLAVERDTALLERLGKLLEIVDRLIDRVADLERELSDERVARERLELRVNAEWLRDRGYSIRTALDADDDQAAGPGADVEPITRTCSRCGERPTIDRRHDLCAKCDDELSGGHRA